MLVTADRRFANKIVDRYPGIDVRYIGAEHFADEIGAADEPTRNDTSTRPVR
jgi:hypothetical protein